MGRPSVARNDDQPTCCLAVGGSGLWESPSHHRAVCRSAAGSLPSSQSPSSWRSQHPPKCGAAGGLKLYFSSGELNLDCSATPSTSFRASLSSRAAPMKLVPLSLTISCGEPLLAMNRRIARIQEAVVSEWASSICIARVVRQVNSAPQRFSERRPTTTCIGPK
ncbi:uncharacterized protein LOC120905684 [Anopheles arabiensis]|uniref:uncharacterized protein LOC120905684 n=1 Tax=Anopheles arabiensis TaxID=7173 RepID=UPI001AACBB1F|nr:uncharacterized protein LOC120905684 [Anopheles arabiensis]